MGKPNWACASCGMYSSRKESVRRHIKNLHSGNAIYVSYTDYLVGRQSGIYASHSNPIYISKNEPSLIHKITDEYCKEIAKECAWQTLHPTLLKQQQSLEPSGNNHAISILNQPYDFWSNRDEIFGLEIMICSKCLAIVPVKVLFSQYDNSAGRSSTHICNTTMVQAISQIIINQDELANSANHLVPTALREYVNAWTNNKNMLVGIEVPYVAPHAINDNIDLTKRVTLQWHERKGGEAERKRTKSIALPFYFKRCLDVDLTNSRSDNELYHNWAERIVKEKQTILNNDELMDFLNKVKDATFAFFRIEKHKGTICYYFMAIIPATTNNIELNLLLDNQSNSTSFNQMQQRRAEDNS